MGLADSLAGLVAAYPSFTVPFVTWLLMGYFGSIPEELEGAAMIAERRREQLEQDLRDWGFAVASRRLG